jgi:hypothetical protein
LIPGTLYSEYWILGGSNLSSRWRNASQGNCE